MNKANIKNPNHDAYWQEKGYSKRLKDWKTLIPKASKRQKKIERNMTLKMTWAALLCVQMIINLVIWRLR
jgi:hypothetical protein